MPTALPASERPFRVSAKKVFEKYGIEPSLYFVVTDLGVTKAHNFDKLPEETDIALKAVLKKL
jgi:uncharacterized metal-binding protein